MDARNIRNIVLMRPVGSIIEFKQIIGRGTRLFEGKDYFTIYDFVKAYAHFNDPEWDGEPAEPAPVEPRGACEPKTEYSGNESGDAPMPPRQKVRIKLADGKERMIQHLMATSFITGGSSGIGRAAALSFARQGADGCRASKHRWAGSGCRHA